MNFQVTVLKILVAYPDGFVVMEDIKRIWPFWRPAGVIGPIGPGAWRRDYGMISTSGHKG